MTTIHFRVPAVPVAQPRPKASTIHGRAMMYEAKKSHPIHDFKASVRKSAVEAYDGPPLDGPLVATLVFTFPSKKKRAVWKVTRPDCDNLAKGCLDSLNAMLYRDDSQIVELKVLKRHAASDEQPHVLVTIETIPS